MWAALSFLLIVFLCNLAPAFAPPTWSIIVLFHLNTNLPTLYLILAGALSAALGRYFLAKATGKLRRFISPEKQQNLIAAVEVFEARENVKILTLILFILSPLPSAQLFEAVGLLGLPLKRFTLAFFSGRLVTYTIYALGAATIKERALGDLIKQNLTSIWGIALQVAMIAGIILITKIDWRKYLKK